MARDTRRILLAAAAEELARHGPAGARVKAIADRAGVNGRMLYRHFEGKLGLYRAVVADQWEDVAAAWAPAIDVARGLDPRDGLLGAFTTLARLLAERPLALPLAFHEALDGRPTSILERPPLPLRVLFKRGQRAGRFRGDLSFDTLYQSIVGAIVAMTLLAPRPADLAGALRLLVDGALSPKAT